MLGKDLVEVLSYSKYNVIKTTKSNLDITNQDIVEKFFSNNKFDLVINCAAYTNVDKAETEEELSFLVNETGAKNIAIASAKKNIPVIYISTDYVFDGAKKDAYLPTDKANPINVYGKSKLAGEIAVSQNNQKHYIVRTSWLYAKHGKNFVNTILEIAKTRKEIEVVNDQTGCPTNTMDLSKMIKQLIETKKPYGTYHLCGTKSMSWFNFAKEIFKINNLDVNVIPIKTKELSRVARRPKNSSMKNSLYI